MENISNVIEQENLGLRQQNDTLYLKVRDLRLQRDNVSWSGHVSNSSVALWQLPTDYYNNHVQYPNHDHCPNYDQNLTLTLTLTNVRVLFKFYGPLLCMDIGNLALYTCKSLLSLLLFYWSRIFIYTVLFNCIHRDLFFSVFYLRVSIRNKMHFGTCKWRQL